MRAVFAAVLSLCVCAGASAEIDLKLFSGTYNVTWLAVNVPTANAQALLPQNYALLNATAATQPVVIELGREIKTGVPGISFTFQEAKLEVPNVRRVDKSSTPFMYKKSIWVDSELQAVSSLLVYGLNSSTQTFIPSDSSATAGFDYSIKGVLEARLTALPAAQQAAAASSMPAYENYASMPWFGPDSVLCSQHVYNFTSFVQNPVFLSGTVNILEGNGIQGTYTVSAVHLTATFSILAPQLCEGF
ncbi:hypothetical protein HDU84_008142 [Entophlyctis sp. JEL0112]|nr:hypothetical protein HDU84_008142 [Entophlyctis sp. JEL0112]